jgi:4-amino-4-deoxy-L-arabinose transferase-like glycosyltransferase
MNPGTSFNDFQHLGSVGKTLDTAHQQDMPAPRPSYKSELLQRLSLNKSDLFWCSILCATSVLIRGIYISFSGIPSQRVVDPDGYVALVRNIAAGYGFTVNGVLPYTYRPPLFSWLLGAWCYLLGSTSLSTMIAFQILAQSITASMTYILIRLVSARKFLAITGGFFIAAYPFIFSNVVFILQEPTQMFLATTMAVAVVVWYQAPNISGAIAVGLLFGFGVLAKSPNLIIPFITCFVWFLSRDFQRRVPLQQLLLLLGATIIVVSPWTFRNFLVTDNKFILVNSQDNEYLTWLVADGKFRMRKSLSDPPIEYSEQKSQVFSYGNVDGVDYLRSINNDLLARGQSISTIEEMVKVASIHYLSDNPIYVFKKLIRGLVLLVSPDSGRIFKDSLRVRILMALLFHLPLFFGLLIGTSFAIIRKNFGIVIISLSIIVYLLIHAPVTVGRGRYTVPLIPLLIAVTVYGISQFIAKRKGELT